MNGRLIRLLIVAVILLGAGGCLNTTYSSNEDAETPSLVPERRVNFFIARAFYRAPPECVTIVTNYKGGLTDVHRALEDAVERHLRVKFSRVLGAPGARSKALRLGLDLNNRRDRRIFSRNAWCNAFADIQIEKVEEQYLVLWANKSVSVSLRITRAKSDDLLWRAHHRASRGDGGIPISVVSLPLSIARASRVKGDREMFHSIVDDAIRRMMITLPDTRRLTINSRR